MLKAETTRDLNQAARGAIKFLKELGIELPHAKALDLVARLAGSPHHMAAQATLPDTGLQRPVELKTYADLKGTLACLTDKQLAMPITACRAGGADSLDFFGAWRLLRAAEIARPGVLETERPVLVMDEDAEERLTQATADGLESMCRTLLAGEGGPDAQEALATAAWYVDSAFLKELPERVLRRAYEKLEVTASPEQHLQGHGNWSLPEGDFALADRLAKAIAEKSAPPGRNAAGGSGSPVAPSQDVMRLRAQFEMATGQSAATVDKELLENDLDQVIVELNARHDIGLRLGPWVVVSDREGFWCNDFGWTTSILAATGYHDDDVKGSPPARLPAGGRWGKFADFIDTADEDAGPTM